MLNSSVPPCKLCLLYIKIKNKTFILTKLHKLDLLKRRIEMENK